MNFPTYVWTFVIAFIAIQALPTTAEELKCFECTPGSDTDCLDSSKLQSKVCDAGVSKCYTNSAEKGVSRGCYKNDDTFCTEGNSCRLCDKSECNNQNICKTCDTNDNDCSVTDVSNTKYNGVCKTSSAECFVNVKDKKVERRCANENDICSDSTICKKCTGINCNSGIFPADRRKCFQCKDSGCDAFGSNKDNAKVCSNYVANDKCYVTGTSAESMIRGCLSDTDPKPCEENAETCSVCNTDSCNSLLYKRSAKCIQCKDTEDCKAEQSVDKATDCKEQILYNQTDACYTLTKDSKVQRGCLVDDAATVQCGADNKACTRCQENGCNRAKVDIKFTCIVCRSDIEKKCWNNAKELEGSECRTNPSSAEEGCFWGIWNGNVIRGCYVDADEHTKVLCSDKNNKQCQLCHEKDCNTAKSSADSHTKSLSLLILVALVFIQLK